MRSKSLRSFERMNIAKVQIYVLLLSLLGFVACRGQSPKKLPETSVSSPQKIPVGNPKLVKTQGTGPSDNIHCSLQDKAGNLWFGTTGEGVYRYDGQLFTQFTTQEGLSDNNVWSLLEDKAGNIWFGTSQGPCLFDGKQVVAVPIVSSFVATTGNEGHHNAWSTPKTVWSMLQDRNGIIWFGTGEGVFCFDGKAYTRFLENYKLINRDNLQLKMVSCMLEDAKGNIWLGSGMPPGMEGLCRFDGVTLERFKPKNQSWIRNIIEDKNGNIVFTTRSAGMCSYDGKTFSFIATPPAIDFNSMTTCMEDKAGNLWFASDYGQELDDTVGGLWRYDGKTFVKFSIEGNPGENAVWTILEDRDGFMWVGTRNIGLYRLEGEAFARFSE
jgi:ligand-binding sensor domain-containing protein